MLEQEIIESPVGRSTTLMQAHHSSLRDVGEATRHPENRELSFDVDKNSSHSFVVPTKGSNHDKADNGDTKTVTTATSDFIDGASTGGESFSNEMDQQQDQEQTKHSELDWSFLRDGELFDRQEQQQQLLNAFYRQLETETENAAENSGDDVRDSDDLENNPNFDGGADGQRSQSFRNNAASGSGSLNLSEALMHRQRPETARRTSRHSSYSFRNSSCSFRMRSKEFVIVSGLSGTGKTILVEETLKGPVIERGGYFLCGKLDQLNKANSSPQRPYAPFVMAFSNLVDSVITNADVTEEIRKVVCSEMSNRDIDLILDTFPSLARILRPDALSNGNDGVASKNKMNGAENQTQLARVVRIFFKTICNPKTRPIVLLIDDLQWADQGTLVLLKALLSETEEDRVETNNGLLLVGTCRHNEVTVDDELAQLLRTLEDEEFVTICQIEVSNLSRPVCGELFARVLGIPPDNYTPELASSLDPLVDIAYEQTEGNPFFLLQFIRSLHDEGYLQVQTQQAPTQKQARETPSSSPKFLMDDDTYDMSELSFNTSGQLKGLQKAVEEGPKQQPHNWLWSAEDIINSSIHDSESVKQDAVPILTHQIKRLPPQVQETIMVASCLGSEFEKQVLQMAMPTRDEKSTYSPEILSMSLSLLIEKDFVRISARPGYYTFSHDKIQQAAIALINDNERALFCTNIGRRVLEHAGKSKSELIFLIVNFFSHGVSEGIITDSPELMTVATLAMEAGETAASMSDFVTAATYLNLGISCLQSNYVGIRDGWWKHEYDFSLAIYNAAAEVEYCVANFERMETLIKEILFNARGFHDKMRAYSTMIVSLGSRERLLEAIAQGFSLLEVVGERFHRKDLKIFLLIDLIKTKRMLKNFDADLDRMPEMKDKDKLAAMEILNLIFPYCTMLKHPKAPHAIFRMVQLTVKYGVTATSATGFAGFGMGLCGIGDFVNGNRYGKIALRILEHFEAKSLICRVYCLYYGFISNWNRPLAMNLGPSMEAHKMGLSTGDIDFAGASASIYATNSIHAGRPLEDIDFEVTKLQELLILFRQTAARSVISPILQHVYNLRAGKDFCDVPWILTGNACDEETLMVEAKASNNIMCLSQFYFRKLWMSYVFNNYEYALAMADESRVTIKSSPSSFFVFSHYFFEGMTCMALVRSPKTKFRKKKYLSRANRCLKILKKYNNYCRRNCLNKYLMLKAEFKVMEGDLSGGLELFEKSASISQEEGFMHEQAIAYERAGLAVLHEKSTDETLSSELATEYFTKSIYHYQLWGAKTKVDQMIDLGYRV